MGQKLLPDRVLTPGTLQVAHIGFEGGLHAKDTDLLRIRVMKQGSKFGAFHEKVNAPISKGVNSESSYGKRKGFGGWGHPADHEHCLKLFGGQVGTTSWREKLGIW
jgi:hypothetical protein